MRPNELLPAALRLAVIVTAFAAANAQAQNPCAPKNPCAPVNPCAAAKNPGAAPARIDPRLVTRPAGTTLARGDHAALVKEGERLFNDTRLSGNGMSCQSCHAKGASFNASFAQPYPHRVGMPEQRAGMKQIAMDEMVQFCMVAAMAGKPLPWNSRELAALTAYTGQVQKDFQRTGGPANPCAARNPCAPRNPCAAK